MSGYLRTNYRTPPQELIGGGINSVLVMFDDFASLHGTYSIAVPVTVSMLGYGKPQWLAIVGMSQPGDSASIPIYGHATNSFSGSIGWLYVYGSDGAFSNSVNMRVLALIGSR